MDPELDLEPKKSTTRRMSKSWSWSWSWSR